jgi:hypothetical protein
MLKGFIKNKEDFTCENCSAFITGNGYTNHCHMCMFSKHVDIAPGDRLEACQGLMKPVHVEGSTNNVVITHTCQTCGFVRRNKLQKDDDIKALVLLIEKLNSQR